MKKVVFSELKNEILEALNKVIADAGITEKVGLV
jgi:hypothetical protein